MCCDPPQRGEGWSGSPCVTPACLQPHQPIPAVLSALCKTGFDAVQAVEAGSSVCLALGIELVEINKIKF